MTIEYKYNELRGTYLGLYDIVDGNHTADSAHRLAEICTELSASAWPEDRCGIAERKEHMPNGPLRYSVGNGYPVWSMPGRLSSLCTHRSRVSGDTDVLGTARGLLRAEYLIKAEAAEKAFVRYALAVAQGVAVPE
jgi:hypothetical protein